MSGKPKKILVTTKGIMKELYETLTGDEFKQKYKNGDKLSDTDIGNIQGKIINAFKNSYGTVGNDAVNKVFGSKNNVESKVKEYLKKVLTNLRYGDEDYNKFLSQLVIPEDNNTPYSLNTRINLSTPNIMANIAFYSKYPEFDAEIRDKLMTEEGIRKFKEDKFNELIAEKEKQLEELTKRNELTKKEQEKLKDEIAQAEYEKEKALKGVKIAKEGFDYVVGGIKDIKDNSNIQNAALGKLLESNRSDVLNNEAFTRAGDLSFKKNIRKIKGELKASPNNYSDNEINYIITKALSENERYLKTVAANPDLFERDMSNDTIQKENEQFQSKLRQQNLRYILPKFIERRDKLVENTLNPNLLKGAFAV